MHGVGGALGALLTGVFAAKAFNPPAPTASCAAAAASCVTQIIGVGRGGGVRGGRSASPSSRSIDKTIGLRVTPDEEREGLDTALHGESGYEMGSTGAGEVHYEAAEPEPATTVARPLVAAR